jgi:ribosomal-protein-serine acetyltransferase
MFKLQIDHEISINLLIPKHAPILVEELKKNQNSLKEWLIWAENIPNEDEYKKTIIPMWLQKFADNNGFEAGIYRNNHLVGMVGLHYIDWTNKATEIGYWLSEDVQGKGLMTRTINGLLTYCFNELELNRVVIRAATENLKSRGVPERLGFKEEGILREAQKIRDRFVDLAVYSMIKSEWVKK